MFKDSYRIFPISLDKLCKNFNVVGKLTPYNPLFNKISVLKDPILKDQLESYSLQDSIAWCFK